MAKTRQIILESACHLFAKYGYSGVSMDQIAKRTKMTSGTLHYHFTSKESLYTEVFRKAFDVDHALTHEVLLHKEPLVFDSPDGRAYAIQRVVFDYFRRHFFFSEEWKTRLVYMGIKEESPIFQQLAVACLSVEIDKLIEFFHLLQPEGTAVEAYYWSHLPDTQGFHYYKLYDHLDARYGSELKAELPKVVTKYTAKTMIALVGLPIPPMLE